MGRHTIRNAGFASWGALAIVLYLPALTQAQEDPGNPDKRDLAAYLMLIVDTSASMERIAACSCQTPSCVECLPDCNATTVAARKNGWATVLGALTGGFGSGDANFQCRSLARTTQNGMTYDVGDPLPYHQPWGCSGTAPCAYPTTLMPPYQNSDGILDLYKYQFNFGLMTLDGRDTYQGSPELTPASSFDRNRSDAAPGMWSYGGPKSFHYPNCVVDYMIDTGARGHGAVDGALIPANACTPNGACPSFCGTCTLDDKTAQPVINNAIQAQLLMTRPFESTPIAGALDDLDYHLRHDLNDPFFDCRTRYGLVITDGFPDQDYRDYGCDCQTVEECGGDDPGAMHCPYPTPEEAAHNLVYPPTGSTVASLKRLFVVGLATNDPAERAKLNAIAANGCTLSGTNACKTPAVPNGDEALFATDQASLISAISNVLESGTTPISRSVPAFAIGTGLNKQYQFSTGFAQPSRTDETAPWVGFIERRRFICDFNGALQGQDLVASEGDLFHEELNDNSAPARSLWTVVPGTGTSTGNPETYMFGDTGVCSGVGCARDELDQNISPLALGLTTSGPDQTLRTKIVDWMHGASGSARGVQGSTGKARRMGDIYHSSPVVLGPPLAGGADEAYRLFAQRNEVRTRPTTLYINSNDGILHAFSVENYLDGATQIYSAGQEMWGFVPPILLNDLRQQLPPADSGFVTPGAHQYLLDTTPVIKDVYFDRTRGQTATNTLYHTVLITGTRHANGKAYIALDITNPRVPVFLWQFTDPDMGINFAQPALAQARFQIMQNSTLVTKDSAVAILPGGVGALDAVGPGCTSGATRSMRPGGVSAAAPFTSWMPTAAAAGSHRSDVRCWGNAGRVLYFVDVQTGKLIKKLRPTSGTPTFPSPLVGAPAVFPNETGALASRAFIMDADGVLWRIDLSTLHLDADKNNPMTGWTARPFHDLFWDTAPTAGELTYEAPILSVDNDQNLVVISGTGDSNYFVKPNIRNRVVSLTEVVDPSVGVANPERFKARLNWEKRVKPGNGLVDSELITGQMALFNRQLFFGTFIAVSSSNACDLGKGRIHSVDYLLHDVNDSNPGTIPQTYGPLLIVPSSSDDNTNSVINVSATEAAENFMVLGLGVTQRPSCSDPEPTAGDYWGTQSISSQSGAPPAMFLVAHASGASSAGGLIQARGGVNARLGSIELQMNKRGLISRMLSWATSVD